MTSSQPRIFISHSTVDINFVAKLAQDLSDVLGDDAVWYDASDREGLRGGDSWWSKIREELRARDVFIVVLSPDAMLSRYVHLEVDLAIQQKFSKTAKVEKLILPLLYRQCEVRDDLSTLQMVRFLEPTPYETAFKKLLVALGLSTKDRISGSESKVSVSTPVTSTNNAFVQQLERQIEEAFAARDWSAVTRKAEFLIKRAPDSISASVYHMQGVAFFEEDETQHARDALYNALILVSDRAQRLIFLSDYARVLASLGQWAELLRSVREALRLAPGDLDWLVRQAEAFLQLGRNEEARAVYDRLRTSNSNDKRVQTLGSALAKIDEIAPTLILTPQEQDKQHTKTTSVKDFSGLGAGVTAVGRYEITQVISEGEQEHVYQVIDHQGYQHCWNCGSEQNAEGDEYCIDCGAALLNASYIMHEYATSNTKDADVSVLSGTIVNTFVDRGKTYVIEQPQATQMDFPKGVHLLAASASDAGDVQRSEPNEDSTLVLQFQPTHESIATSAGVFIVADGLSEYDNGQVASRKTIRIVAERIVRELLSAPLTAERAGEASLPMNEDGFVALFHGAVEDAHIALCGMNRSDKTDMRSTITGFMVVEDYAYILNVGDSRTYILRDKHLYQVTNDHSLVGQLVAGGLIEPDDVYTHPQRSQIFRSLGDKPNVQIDIFKQQLLPGDVLLSCSDGLWEMVRNPQITDILNAAPDPQTACSQLIEAANTNGGEGNVSVVVVFVC